MLVVPSMIPVATKLSRAADHNPTLRPNLLLKGPTSSDDMNVPMVINDDMSCWTVGCTPCQLSS
jgi:hypothetical protein